MLNWFFPIELIKGIIRDSIGDWTYDTIERRNFVDMNRIFGTTDDIDPYDFQYWSNKADGLDCNGKKGKGLYCFCPS